MVLTYFLSMADGWCTEPEAAGAFNSLSPPPLLQPLRPRGFLKLNKNHSRQQPKTAVCLLHNCSAAVQTYKLWLLHTEYVEHPPTPPHLRCCLRGGATSTLSLMTPSHSAARWLEQQICFLLSGAESACGVKTSLLAHLLSCKV